ncbi:MAG: hypothetical protein ACKVQC_06650 [Elusimicrobiota bacterium]
MNQKCKGSVLVMFIFFLLIIFMYFQFVLCVSQVVIQVEKINSKGEALLCSLLRLKSQIWETIPYRWNDFGSKIFLNGSRQLAFTEVDRAFILQKAKELKNAIPAYKARLTSYQNLMKKVYDVSSFSSFSTGIKTSQLELEPKDGVIINQFGEKLFVQGLWYKRLWKLPGINLEEGNESMLTAEKQFQFQSMVGLWNWKVRSQYRGRIQSRLAKEKGFNSGFPENESDLIFENKFLPFRYPFFKVSLESVQN